MVRNQPAQLLDNTSELQHGSVVPRGRAFVARHLIPVFALLILGFGCFNPIGELMVPPLPSLIPKTAYALFWLAAFLLLRQPSHSGVKSSGWWFVDAIICTYTIVPALQISLHLPRPEGSPIGFFHGFPSGHAVTVFSLAWLVHKTHHNWSLPAFAAAVVIALTRIDSSYHFPYQVMGGAILGIFLGALISRCAYGLVSPILRKLLTRWRLHWLVALIGGPAEQAVSASQDCISVRQQ